jgi:hypothetical protein
MGAEQSCGQVDAMTDKDNASYIDVYKYRVFSLNNNGGILASSICDEDDIEKYKEAMSNIPGTKTTNVIGPILVRRDVNDE